jgi:predicted kinase
MKVTLLVGPSGSGKSTFTSKLPGKVIVCSADHHFIDEDGQYKYTPSEIGKAHGACLRRFVASMLVNADNVVVDNTNTTTTELAPYVALGTAYNREVEILVFGTDLGLGTLVERNVHCVPETAIAQMVNRMERMLRHVPHHWPAPQYVSKSGEISSTRPV